MKLYPLLICILSYTQLLKSTEGSVTPSSIKIKETGLKSVAVGSIAVVLYTVLYNNMSTPASIEIMAQKCCIKEADKRDDCDIMIVYGGFSGKLLSSEQKTVRFVFPTLYPHDLIGYCVLFMTVDTLTRIINIPFNTTLVYHKPLPWLPDFISEYLFDIPVPKNCKSQDEDRFNDCSPVSCVVKYHGHRNFFNQQTRLCNAVSACPENPPFQISDSVTGTCIDLSQSLIVTEREKKLFPESPQNEFQIVDFRTERRLDCNNGVHTSNGNDCICHAGWESSVLPDQEIESGLLQMCNHGKKGYWKYILVAIAIAVFLIFVLQCVHATHRRRRREKQYRELSQEVSPVKEKSYRELSQEISPVKSGCFQTQSNINNSSRPDVYIQDDSFEFEKDNVLRRFIHKMYNKLVPAKTKKLDFSLEEINVGTTLLSPVSMDDSYEIN